MRQRCELDWYEALAGHALIARLVDRSVPGSARLEVIPRTDHHFTAFARPEDAVGGTDGTVSEGPAVEAMLGWLRETLKYPASQR